MRPGSRAKWSQLDSPLPSSLAAPSIWGAAAATPQTKFFGNSGLAWRESAVGDLGISVGERAPGDFVTEQTQRDIAGEGHFHGLQLARMQVKKIVRGLVNQPGQIESKGVLENGG